jgi:hypothetical protein
MLGCMQAYSIAFSAAVLWLLASLGSISPGVAVLLGVFAGGAILWIGRAVASEDGGREEPEAARE